MICVLVVRPALYGRNSSLKPIPLLPRIAPMLIAKPVLRRDEVERTGTARCLPLFDCCEKIKRRGRPAFVVRYTTPHRPLRRSRKQEPLYACAASSSQ